VGLPKMIEKVAASHVVAAMKAAAFFIAASEAAC